LQRTGLTLHNLWTKGRRSFFNLLQRRHARVRNLREHLDAVAATGRKIEFWWRDDDAGPGGDRLARLLSLSNKIRVGVALAVVPTRVTPELIDMIRQTRNVDVLVHGWRHRSYSLSSEKKSEFPQSRSLPDMVEDAQRALAAMKSAFPDHCLPSSCRHGIRSAQVSWINCMVSDIAACRVARAMRRHCFGRVRASFKPTDIWTQ
jgi:hypothetical protein